MNLVSAPKVPSHIVFEAGNLLRLTRPVRTRRIEFAVRVRDVVHNNIASGSVTFTLTGSNTADAKFLVCSRGNVGSPLDELGNAQPTPPIICSSKVTLEDYASISATLEPDLQYAGVRPTF